MGGAGEYLVIGLILLLLFGAGSIPKLARSLGKAKREFDKGRKDEDSSTTESGNDDTNA